MSEGEPVAPPQAPAAGGRPKGARRRKALRWTGWAIGAGVILGTAALVAVALMQPEDQKPAVQTAMARVCPPMVSIPARGPGRPVDDIHGVRPGMDARDVEETIKCVSEDYEVRIDRVGAEKRPVITARRGSETLTFALYGPAGMERVQAGWRDIVYDAGEGPPAGAVEAAFITQYGLPHEARDTSTNQRVLSWTFGPDDKPLRVKPREGLSSIIEMPAYVAAGFTVSACLKNVQIDPRLHPVWDARCGLTIRAEISPQLSDPTHTARARVALLDQPGLMRSAQGQRALAAPAAARP